MFRFNFNKVLILLFSKINISFFFLLFIFCNKLYKP